MSKSSILLQAAATSRLLDYELKLQKGQGSYAVIKASRSTDQAQCPLGSKTEKLTLSKCCPRCCDKHQQVRLVPEAEVGSLMG
jgi:hypothetical protein